MLRYARTIASLRGIAAGIAGAILMVPMVMVLEGRSTAQNDLAAGRDVLRYFEPAGVTPGPMDVFIHKPAAWRPQDGRLLVVLHGADRNATLLRDTWRPIAERYNLLLIVPEFSEAKFPGTLWYNLGNVTDAARRPQPKAAWTFHALDRAVDAVRQATGAVNDRFQLYGFSAGAQFAHRYLLLTGAPRVDLVVADSGGWYTLPDPTQDYPCGLGGAAPEEEALRSALGHPLVVDVGQHDTKSTDYFGADGYEACAGRQGVNRVARGQFFIAFGKRQAERLKTEFAWRLIEAPGVGHSQEEMAEHASNALFAHMKW